MRRIRGAPTGWGETLLTLAAVLALIAPLDAQEIREPLWTVALDGAIFASPAAGTDEVIYVGTEIGGTPPGTEDGRLYGVSRTGAILFAAGHAQDWVTSSAAVAPTGMVYTADWSGVIYGHGPGGNLLWTMTESAGDIFIGSPAVGSDGTLYLGGLDGIVYAVTGAGAMQWIHVGHGSIDTSVVLDADENVVYVEDTPGGARLVSLAPGGAQRWAVALPARDGGISAASAAPAVDFSGTLYLPYKIEFPGSDRATEGSMIAVTRDGLELWSFELDTPINQTPVLSEDEMLYAVTEDGLMLAIDDLGFLHWTKWVGPVYDSSPAIAHNGTIYVVAFDADGGMDSLLRAMDSDGEPLWEASISGITDSSPVINSFGELIVGNYAGTLYAFQADGPLSPRGWAAFRQTARNTGKQDATVPPNPFDYYPQSVEFGSGWGHTPTVGYYYRPFFPWTYSINHGWWFNVGAGDSSMWVYDPHPELGWMWTSHSMYPLLWAPARETWLRYRQGTVMLREFFDYSTNAVIEIAW